MQAERTVPGHTVRVQTVRVPTGPVPTARATPAPATGASPELRALPGAPETRLTAALAELLPGSTPAPPWRCRVQAVLWWHRASPAALAVLPPQLRDRARRPLVPWPLVVGPLVVGAAVRYLDSPVGPYEEVLGGVLLLPGTLHLPFLAVDSFASLQGGRAHWALPKTLATVRRQPTGEVVADGAGWRIGVTPHPYGPALPVAGRLRGRQIDAAGAAVSSTVTGYGRGRPARVDVQVGTDLAGEPGSIGGWLRSGRHPGAVVGCRLRVAS